jgi:hypothetical protein
MTTTLILPDNAPAKIKETIADFIDTKDFKVQEVRVEPRHDHYHLHVEFSIRIWPRFEICDYSSVRPPLPQDLSPDIDKKTICRFLDDKELQALTSGDVPPGMLISWRWELQNTYVRMNGLGVQ